MGDKPERFKRASERTTRQNFVGVVIEKKTPNTLKPLLVSPDRRVVSVYECTGSVSGRYNTRLACTYRCTVVIVGLVRGSI